ncbi:MAG: SBBP repeat-containing protein [Candidatus Baltobacteraceae bacterium]
MTKQSLTAAAAFSVLVGCAGNQQTMPLAGPQTPHESFAQQGMRPPPLAASLMSVISPPAADLVIGAGQDNATAAGGLYVAQYKINLVNEYALPDTKNDPPKCVDAVPGPEGYVNGVGVNAQHVLYVPGFYAGKAQVLTFAANCGSAGPTLNDPNGFTVDVAFDNAKGTVYVADPSTNGIDAYAKGATSPTRTLSSSVIQRPYGVAVDRVGNVFLSGTTSSNVVEFPKGHQKGSRVLGLTGLKFPVGLEFDLKNNLIVIDDSAGILIYAPPYSGAPNHTFATKGTADYGKLDAANHNFYVNNLSNGSADVYAYPSGKYRYSITNGLSVNNTVTGIAVDPPSPN